MNRVITIGRQFGSGGRELGRRLAEELDIEYYDREILEQIAEHTSFSMEYVTEVVEGRRHHLYPITVNHSFNFAADHHARMLQSVYQAQQKILLGLAEASDCIIVGRCADYFLRDHDPYRIFVYADMDARIARCMARSEGSEHYTEKEIEKLIRRIDRDRARYYADNTNQKWGDKQYYDLCINTTGKDIKALVPHLAKML